MIQLFAGLITEGTTDIRFFEPLLEKVLIEIAFECRGDVEIIVRTIEYNKSGGFSEGVLSAARKAYESGINMLIVHTDADDATSANSYATKIDPAMQELDQQDGSNHCKVLIALVPIQETESWMLADKELVKKQIGTSKTDIELDIDGHPETFRDPKEKIINAIRICATEMPRKLRKNLSIDDLYSIIGQSLNIERLNGFNSYQDFKQNIRNALVKLNMIAE